MIKVIFFLVLILPGHKPIPFSEDRASMAECLADVTAVLEAGPPQGGALRAGCVLIDAEVKS